MFDPSKKIMENEILNDIKNDGKFILYIYVLNEISILNISIK